MSKNFTLLVVIVSFSFIFPSQIQAQGTCELDAGPPLQVKNNNCQNGTVPTKEGSDFVPRCVCKTPGSPGQILSALISQPSPGGTCNWDVGPPLQVKDNNCRLGYVPVQEGSPFAPQCVCKPVGTSDAIPGSWGGAAGDANCKTNINVDSLRFCKQYEQKGSLAKSQLKTCTDPQNKPGSKCEKDNQIFCINTDGARDPNQIVCIPAPSTAASGVPCDVGGSRGPGFSTAIGCIHTSPAEFAKDFLKFAIGIGGGLAFLMMLLGAFQMLTSAGNPDSLKAGQERLTSAVIGLLFVIFATLFLQIIGFDILKLPGFSR